MALLTSGISAALYLTPAFARDELEGEAFAIDGDTLELAGKRIRLFALSAPEMKTCAGPYARLAMDKLIDGKEVRCELTGKKSYKRDVAVCFVGDTNLAEAMIEQGWGIEYRTFSYQYARQEHAAAEAQLGMWDRTLCH